MGGNGGGGVGVGEGDAEGGCGGGNEGDGGGGSAGGGAGGVMVRGGVTTAKAVESMPRVAAAPVVRAAVSSEVAAVALPGVGRGEGWVYKGSDGAAIPRDAPTVGRADRAPFVGKRVWR